MAPSELAPVTDAATILQVVARAASSKAVDIDKMQKLMEMHERIVHKTAEAAFNEALSEAQAKMRPVATDADNDHTRSKYATYAALDRALRPIYTAVGISISYDTADSPRPECVRVLAYVARGGYSRTYRADMPADGKGAKGGDVMTKTHAAGAAMSYGMRYLLKMIFNVAVGEDDTDGNATNYERISAGQVAGLNKLLQEVGADKGRYLQYLKLDKLEDIPAANYAFCVRAAEAKRKAPAGQVRK
jgi:hypothetical protein